MIFIKNITAYLIIPFILLCSLSGMVAAETGDNQSIGIKQEAAAIEQQVDTSNKRNWIERLSDIGYKIIEA